MPELALSRRVCWPTRRAALMRARVRGAGARRSASGPSCRTGGRGSSLPDRTHAVEAGRAPLLEAGSAGGRGEPFAYVVGRAGFRHLRSGATGAP